jgi:hypothetical protein
LIQATNGVRRGSDPRLKIRNVRLGALSPSPHFDVLITVGMEHARIATYSRTM